jgi:N-methylhydantoinase A/oxoprolinase/acetone carboxylase beta subunit
MQQQRQQQQSFPTARRAEIEPAGATTTAAAGSSLMEVSVFMTEQLKEQLQLQRDHDEKVRAEMEAKLTAQHALQMERNAQAKTERAELEAKFEARLAKQRCDMVAQVEALEAKLLPQRAQDAISEQQLEALQLRLQSLHAAELLSDDELFSLEDSVIDCIEVLPTASVDASSVDKVLRMIRVSEKVAADGSLARQLRRKFV